MVKRKPGASKKKTLIIIISAAVLLVTAAVITVLLVLGGEKELTMEQIQACIDLRKKFNTPGRHPGYKKFSK